MTYDFLVLKLKYMLCPFNLGDRKHVEGETNPRVQGPKKRDAASESPLCNYWNVQFRNWGTLGHPDGLDFTHCKGEEKCRVSECAARTVSMDGLAVLVLVPAGHRVGEGGSDGLKRLEKLGETGKGR